MFILYGVYGMNFVCKRSFFDLYDRTFNVVKDRNLNFKSSLVVRQYLQRI